MTAAQLVEALWGIGMLAHCPSEAMLRQATERARKAVDEFSASDVVRIMWAVAVMVCGGGSREAGALIGVVAERAEKLLGGSGVDSLRECDLALLHQFLQVPI